MKRNGGGFLLGTVLFAICLGCGSNLPDQGITMLSPKANERIQGGSTYDILWKVEVPESEFGTMVTIQVSRDGGKFWENVAENIPANGKYAWKVPTGGSAQWYKIRVFSQYRPKYRGTSEPFSVG